MWCLWTRKILNNDTDVWSTLQPEYIKTSPTRWASKAEQGKKLRKIGSIIDEDNRIISVALNIFALSHVKYFLFSEFFCV